MRPLLLAVALLASLSTGARAESFEGTSAVKVARLEDIVWALAAPCDAGDDTQQRQCRIVRDKKAATYVGKTMLVSADATAFTAGEWDTARKSLPMRLASCIACGGLEIDGRTYYVVGSGTAPRFEGGKLQAGSLYNNAKRFPDQAAAAAYVKNLAAVRVDLLVKVPAQRTRQSSGKNGVALEVVGYRVVTACDGAVVISNPAAASVPADKTSCSK